MPPIRTASIQAPTVLAGLGPAIHDFLCEIKEVVDGLPEPVLGPALGRTRGQAMTGDGPTISHLLRRSVLDSQSSARLKNPAPR
jgi:hypothetical protein